MAGAFRLEKASYPLVQPVAFSWCLRRAANGATIDWKRAGLAFLASSLTLTGDVKKSAGHPMY